MRKIAALAVVLCMGVIVAAADRKGIAACRDVKATGTVGPEEPIDSHVRVAGVIQKFGTDPDDRTTSVDFGTRVREGTVLLQIDPAPYEARARQAKEQVQRAQGQVRLAAAKVALAERE